MLRRSCVKNILRTFGHFFLSLECYFKGIHAGLYIGGPPLPPPQPTKRLCFMGVLSTALVLRSSIRAVLDPPKALEAFSNFRKCKTTLFYRLWFQALRSKSCSKFFCKQCRYIDMINDILNICGTYLEN